MLPSGDAELFVADFAGQRVSVLLPGAGHMALLLAAVTNILSCKNIITSCRLRHIINETWKKPVKYVIQDIRTYATTYRRT